MLAMKSTVSLLAIVVAAGLVSACAATSGQTVAAAPSSPAPAPAAVEAPAAAQPTAADADAFVARAERELGEFNVIAQRAAWVNATYITPDTDALNAHF